MVYIFLVTLKDICILKSMCSVECASEVKEKFIQHIPGRIHAVKEIFSEKECKKLIMDAENAGFQPSPPSGGGHGQTPRTGA